MDLLFDLNQQDGVWIDGRHRVFEKSEYEGLNFRVKIKPLTRTELRRLRREIGRNGNDQDNYLPRIFMSQVIDWRLKDGDGNQLSFDDETKRLLIERFPGFTNLVAAACLDAGVKTAEQMETEIKN